MPTMENIAISVSRAPSWRSERTEMCEHKGIGHPDSLCDGAVEAAAHACAAPTLTPMAQSSISTWTRRYSSVA